MCVLVLKLAIILVLNTYIYVTEYGEHKALLCSQQKLMIVMVFLLVMSELQ